MAKAKYAAGQLYNKIELLKKESDSWICRCHCGTEFLVKHISKVGTGVVTSCGCVVREPKIYKAGQMFNGIELLSNTEGGWVCRCHCGTEFTPKKISRVGNGALKSCGCLDRRRVAYEAGQVFNGIELLKRNEEGWVCRCHCGTEFSAFDISDVRKGKTTSCGCTNSNEKSQYKAGQRYHQVELLRKVAGHWQCLCHCGKEFVAPNITRLRIGQTTSCGCQKKARFTFEPGKKIRGVELVREDPDGWVCRCRCGNEFKTSTVGQLRWANMSCGCIENNSSDPLYLRYRTVQQQKKKGLLCNEWSTFKVFKSEMGNTYFYGAWLDRHDRQKNYSRENCFWSTVDDYRKRRGFKDFLPKGICPCGNEFHQNSSVDHYCCFRCRKTYGGSAYLKTHLTPEQIEELKAEIRASKRGYARPLADKWGISLNRVWSLAAQIKQEKRDEVPGTPALT